MFAVHIHHMLVDDISLLRLANTLHDLLQNNPIEVSEAKENYSRYVQFESQEYTLSDEYQQDLSFWKDDCSLARPENPLPGGKLADKLNNKMTAAYHIQETDPGIVKAIERFCKVNKTTEFHFYLSCFLVVLQRYTGSNCLSVAIPVTTRTDEFRNSFGLFVNTLPFKIDIDMNKSFAEFLTEVSKSWLEYFDHRQFPLDRIVQLGREIGNNPDSLNVMFNYACPEIKLDMLFIKHKHAKMPLSLDVIRKNERTEVILEFGENMIDTEVARRFLKGFLTTCHSAIMQASHPMTKLDVLSDEESNIIRSFESGGHDLSLTCQTKWVHPLIMFEQNVLQNPTSVAVSCDRKHVLYSELDETARRIGSALSACVSSDVLRSRPVFLDNGQKRDGDCFSVWCVESRWIFSPDISSNNGKTRWNVENLSTRCCHNKPARKLGPFWKAR